MAIVTLSRKSGTGAKEIAEAVAKRLRYEFVSKDSIYKEIEEHGKEWLDRVARLDDHAPASGNGTTNPTPPTWRWWNIASIRTP